jgi:hypothetical protein
VEYTLQWQGRWKNHTLCKFWQWAPKKCYRKLKQRHRTLRQESNALLLYYWHRLSGLVSKGSAPRTKGSHFMYPWKQVTEAIKKKLSLIYGYMQFYRLIHSSASALLPLVPCDLLHIWII